MMRKVTPEEVFDSVALQELTPSPRLEWEVATRATCERLHHTYILSATGGWIPDSAFVDLPKWVFLEYLVRHQGVLARGANRPDLEQFPPMVPSRNIVGWDRPCFYAFPNGLQPMFFAILDRQRLQALSAIPYANTLYVPAEGEPPEGCKRFQFGVDFRALSHALWRRGTVYLFARAPFVPHYREALWFSKEPVRPLARISIAPWEWPLLDQVRAIDLPAYERRFNEGMAGWPWGEDTRIHPHLHHRPLVQQLRAYLERHSGENTSLADLSAQTGVSPFKLLRLFRAQVGLSPHEYQTQLRIRQAKRLLRNGMPIAQVAAEAGFVDQSHLTHHFKHQMGVTPGQYLRLQESTRTS